MKSLVRFGSLSSQQCLALEKAYGMQNYKPLPVVLAKGQGVKVWDCEGKEYFDFMSAISSVNQGHCHPRLVKVATEQIQTLTQVARITSNNKLGVLMEYLNKVTGFDKGYFAQGGVDADETAILLARRWGYKVKGIEDGKARILFPKKTFWGRSIAGRAGSDDPLRYAGFGPFGGLNFDLVEFNNLEALENEFKKDKNICGYLLEPILAEGGMFFPAVDYLTKVKQLCEKYKVLFIADEIQTGLGRTGKLFAYEWSNARPDLIVLGKSLSGGFYSMSAVLGKSEIFDLVNPGEMGSTYGGNPLACALAQEAIQIIIDEKLVENSLKMGERLFNGIKGFKSHKHVKDVRGEGRGLFMAIEFEKDAPEGFGWNFALKLLENGIITRPGNNDTVLRLCPPLCITAKQVDESLDRFNKTFASFK